MPHDPRRVAECQGWLRQAWIDLDSATILLRSPELRSESALFRDHQAVVLAHLPEEVRP
jgi:hypothetical protein